MKFGFVAPGGKTLDEQVERAALAEAAGWDAIFLSDGAYHADVWSMLSAVAARTSRIRLGTLLTPLPWREPWTVAAQAATVDQLSGGRVILSVGLGSRDTGRASGAHATGRRERAQLLDEGLEVITRLWRGERAYEGEHYRLELDPRPPRDLRPAQEPRVPIWVVAAWPRPKSLRRALRFDGVLPMVKDPDYRPVRHEDIAGMVGWFVQHGRVQPPDIVMEGETPIDDVDAAVATVDGWAAVGCTWWIESRWRNREECLPRLKAGPPRAVASGPTG